MTEPHAKSKGGEVDPPGPPDKRAIGKARRFVEDAKNLLEKHEARISKDDKEKLEAAMASVVAAIETNGEAKRLSTALKELDARVDQVLGFARKSTAREYTESIVIAILIAVVLRAFVVEAFKIPTGSMIPTLAIGDHIFVNKFIYGLRIPLTNSWFAEWGTPKHGDVIVFRYPEDTSKDYIKRVVAVAGDRVRVDGQDVYVNDVKLARGEPASDMYIDEGEEEGSPPGTPHSVYAYPEKSSGADAQGYIVFYAKSDHERGAFPPPLRNDRGLDCNAGSPGVPPHCVVLPGHVFVMGDNRDNSSDSRVWGGVPTRYVKGKAMFVWWSRGSRSGVRWERIGDVVH